MKPSVVALALCLSWAAQARADVIPPDVDACKDKALGDECTAAEASVLFTGSCQDGEYCHLVYGTCDSGGPPCGTACEPALVCKGGVAPTNKDDGGCAVSLASGTTSAISFLLGCGLLLFWWRRGRRGRASSSRRG